MSGPPSTTGRRTSSARPGERRRLLAALDATVAGRPGITEIRGDPGIGKSRLLSELTRQAARRGVPVVTGRCAPADADLVFGAFRRLLSIRPARPPSTGEDTAGMLDAGRLLLAQAAGDGLVLILDDAHWADPSSIALIDHLIRWPVAAPLLLVVAHRPRQSPPPLLAALAHGEALGTVDRIALGPLRLDQAARLTGLPTDDERLLHLQEASEGNPRYLLGLAGLIGPRRLTAADPGDHGGGEPEHGDHDLVGPLLAELGPRCAQAAWAGAVLGDPFDVDTLAAVADLGIDEACAAIAALTRHDLLRPIDGEATYRLRHPLLARLLYSAIEPGWRRRAHRRAARALSLAGAPPVILAPHIERFPQDAGLHEVHLLADAAKMALASPPDAVRWLRLALRILALADVGEPRRVDNLRGELSLSLARAFGVAGLVAECRIQIRETLELARSRAATERAGIVSQCALLTYAISQHADAREIIATEIDAAIGGPAGPGTDAAEAAEPAVRPQARPAVITLLLTRAAIGLLDGTSPSGGDLALLLRLAHEDDDRTAELGALALQAVAEAFAGEIPAARTTVTRCIAIADRLPDAALVDHPEHLALLGWADTVLGRQLDAERHFKRGAVLARARGRNDALPLLLTGLGAVYQRVGRLPEARRIATELQQLIRNANRGHHTSLAEAVEALAGIWIDGQGSRRAVTLLEQTAVEHATGQPASRRSWWSDVAAIWTAYAGALDGGDARRTMAVILDTGGGETLELISPVLHPLAFEALTAAAGRLGDAATALRWAELAEQAADRLGLGYQRGHALAARAHALRGLAEPVQAGQLYLRAADLFAAAGMLSLQTYLLVQAGGCLAAAGLVDEASRQFSAAGELARRCGANRLGRQALAALRGLEEQGAGGNALATLTPREREIAAAAMKGQTSRQIADDLRLSPRTVDAHLTRIYRKLGVASRVALVRLAGDVRLR